MFSRKIKVLWLMVTLPSFLAHPDGHRSQIDTSVRGNSFGLENFLFQPYENAEVKNAVRIVKTKRVRPAANPRTPTGDRGHTYGLENLSAQVYESNRLKPSPAKPTQDQPKRRPVEPTAESTRVKENFMVKPETMLQVTQEPETPTQEAGTERIRKRIMMRRRRKRPPNTVNPEGNGEITGNAIPKPVRIPIYPQVPKVVIRTKLPDQGTAERLQPVGVKTAMTPQDENESTKVTIGQEEPPTTAVPERSTVTTTATTTTTTTARPSAINLKAFLKQQTETLSLSELLQTQNLSLADLLRGNKDASAILRAKQASTSTAASVKRKQIDRTEPQQAEGPPKQVEIVEVTTPRPSYNGFQPKIPRTKITNHADNKAVDETTQDDAAKPIKRPPSPSDPLGLDPLSRLAELRLKLRNFQKKTSPPVVQVEATRAPPARYETIEPVPAAPKATDAPLYKKNRIPFKSTNNPDLSLILPNKIKPEPETLKRPERLSNWTSRLPSIKRIPQDRPKQNDAPLKPLRIPILAEDTIDSSGTEEEANTTTEIIEALEEIRKPEQKDELIELLKSGQNADRLQKILYSRNMTIQELLDNREKPPLQVNISTLFSSQWQQEPTSTRPTLFDSLPDFEVHETDRPGAEIYDEPEAEESVPVIARVQLVPSREAKQYEFPVSEKGVSQLGLQPDDLAADTSNAEDSALWKLSEKSMYYGSSYGYGEFAASQQTEKPKNVRASDFSEDDIILLETIRRNQETGRKFKLNFKDFVREEEEPETEDIEKSYIPPAVKSAIIASGVVMGIALFVFIAIFAACGWRQRQIRLKGSSNGLGETLGKGEKSKRTLSPSSFKETHSYKKTIDFDDETSESGTSNTSSYLWSTLKNTFTSRASTLKSRLEKDEKLREDKVTLRRNESRRKESRLDDRQIEDEIYTVKKIDHDRNVINTSFNFKRSTSNNNVNHFNECVHGY